MTPWSLSTAARAFSAGTWCVPWPSATIASRVAVRRPELANFLQPLGRVGQIHAVQANLRNAPSVEAAARDAQVLDQPRRHSVRARSPAVRCGPCLRSRAGCTGGQCARGAYGPCVRDRSGREFNQRLRAASKANAEQLVLAAQPSTVDHAALDPVRARGRFLQPLCRAGANIAGAASDRRRAYPFPAGVCRRRCRRDRRRRRRQGARWARSMNWAALTCVHSRSCMQFVLATIERKRLLVNLAVPRCQIAGDASCNIFRSRCSRPIRSNCSAPTTSCRKPPSPEMRTLQGLGIEPEPIEAIVPSYLWRFRKTGQFQQTPRLDVHKIYSARSPAGAHQDAPPCEQREAVTLHVAEERLHHDPAEDKRENEIRPPSP